MAPVSDSFEPMKIAENVSKNLQLSAWREKVGEETITMRWKHLFEKIEPNEHIITKGTGALIRATSGTISPSYLFSIMLAMWTYGAADMASMLADEEITLWEGQPFDFPNWENEVDHPEEPPPGPSSLPPPDPRSPISPTTPAPGGLEATPPKVEQKELVVVGGKDAASNS